MRCDTCRQLLDDFTDRELPENERRSVRQHILECGECGSEAEFLERLSHNAASLPKSLQPGRDLWPGIEAEIRGGENKRDFRRISAQAWRLAAAALLGSILLAAAYLEFRKTGEKPGPEKLPVAHQGVLRVTARPPADELQGNLPGPGVGPKPDLRSSQNRPADGSGITYPIDSLARVFVSNYGIYALRRVRDPQSSAVSRSQILRLDPDGEKSWTPPLPPGSTLLSIYPGEGARLWACYRVREPESPICIAELHFGDDAQIRNVWKGDDLFISGFAMGPQGLIYATGYRSDFPQSVSRRTQGQTAATELVHIVDPATGEERHLFPVTIQPRFESQSWEGLTLSEMTQITIQATIAVNSGGNFFVTIDRNLSFPALRDLQKNTTVEYAPDGTAVKMWTFGSLEPDAYLNRIFVDVDDSLIAEIIRYQDAESVLVKERYLLRETPDGRIGRYDLPVYRNEFLQGWIGQRRELATLIIGKTPEISVRKLAF